VDIRGIHDQQQRMQILERNLAFEQDAQGFREEWEPRERMLSGEIDRARKLLPKVKHTQSDLAVIAGMMAGLGVDGHRADLVILKGARAHAAQLGRDHITKEDILLAAELALPHRLKRQPFQENGQLSMQDLSERLEQAQSEFAGGEDATLDESGEPGGVKKKR
jgi:Mg-chelatase subunit ChlI